MAAKREIRIWSIYNKEDRLVLALSDEPGEFNFAKMPDDDADPVDCDFATLQCYDARSEADILNRLFRSDGLDDFLDRLTSAGYKVREGRPKPRKFARL